MRVLNPVVLPKPARPVQMPQIQLIQSGSVRRQAVGRDRLRLDRLVVEEALQKSERGLCVPAALDHKVQDLALVINGAHRYIRLPPTQQTISSRCQRGNGAPRRFFSRLAIRGPNLIVQHRIVS